MRPGYGFVAHGHYLLGRIFDPYHFRKCRRIIRTVRMGYTDDLIGGVFYKLIILCGNGLECVLFAAHFLKTNYFAFAVALQKGLYVQHAAYHGGYVGQPARTAQMHNIIHCEYLAHFVPSVDYFPRNFFHIRTFAHHFARAYNKKPFAKGCAERIHGYYLSFGILLPEFVGGSLGRGIRSAYAGGHAYEQYIKPLFKHGLHIFNIALRRHLRRGSLCTGTYGVVIRFAVERGNVHAGALISVKVIIERNNAYIVSRNHIRFQIGRSIGHKLKQNTHLHAIL